MTHHTHVLQGRVPGCPPCDSIRPESQVHPHRVPALPAPAPESFGEIEPDEPDEPAEPEHVSALPAETHSLRNGRAVCAGGVGAKCHWWPHCEHDEFPCGHDYIDHGHCWIVDWINASHLEDTDAADGEHRHPVTLEYPDGEISWEWGGDHLLWDYVAPPSYAEEATSAD